MSEHYYSQSPSVEHDRQVHTSTIRDTTMQFVTDRGVFSKEGVDFGSKLLIDSMSLDGKRQILDIGCGYGPIGLYAAKLYPQAKVTLIDINERAVMLSSENAVRNQVHNAKVLQSDRFAQLEGRTFDAILMNPPIRAGKEVVHTLFEESKEHLQQNGELWIVIQKKQGAPSALQKLESLFTEVEEVAKKKGYRIYRAKAGLNVET